jgi:hypothetical protein
MLRSLYLHLRSLQKPNNGLTASMRTLFLTLTAAVLHQTTWNPHLGKFRPICSPPLSAACGARRHY